jgi:tetratricopeptide (TPR) repeat protein
VSDPADQLAVHVAWSEGPWLGFVFAPSDAAADQLREQALTQGPAVRCCRPRTPQGLRRALSELLDQPTPDHLVWLQAVPAPGDESPWTEAWDSVLLRANQQRQRLLDASSGWVFVLPASAKVRTRESAPDLWSVRALTLELADAPSAPLPPPEAPDPLRPHRDASEAAIVQGWASEAVDAASAWLHGAQQLPAGEGRRRELAGAHEHLARAHRALGDLPAALEHARQAVQQLRGLPDDPSDELRHQPTALARCLSLWGQLLDEADAPEAALPVHTEALAIRQQLAAHSDDPETLADLATSWSMLGDLASHRGDLHGASEAYTEALRLRRRLADDTGALRHRRLLSVALGRHGRVLCRQGRRRRGLQRLREADALAQALRRLEPGNAAWHMEAAVARTHLAACLADHDRDEALRLALDARDLQRQLLDEEPDNQRWAAFLDRSEALVSRLHTAVDDP